MNGETMILDHTLSTCHRGSSPSNPASAGMDNWVRGMRIPNDSAAACFSLQHDEYGTLPGRLAAEAPGDNEPSPPANA